MATEQYSQTIYDPTANTLALVEAAIKRQDDLRSAEALRISELLEKNEEITGLQIKFQQELALAESKRVDALALAESRRIDALLTTAQNAVNLAALKADAQAQTLASTVANSAEALRTQVAAAAETTATATLRDTLDKRITSLEQNQYQTGGRNAEKTENKQTSQWTFGAGIITINLIVVVLLHFWK